MNAVAMGAVYLGYRSCKSGEEEEEEERLLQAFLHERRIQGKYHP